MRRRSIARRLIISVLLIQLVSAAGVVLATIGYERHTHFSAFDVMLRGHADSLLGAVGDTDDAADDIALGPTAALQLGADDIYEVTEASGRVLGRSANFTRIPSAPPGSSVNPIFQADVHGAPYRFIRISGIRTVDPDNGHGGVTHSVTVVYGAPTTSVWAAIRRAVYFYTAASCLLLLITGSLVAWLLHQGLLPLRQLASEAERISVERWTFRAPEAAHATAELAPLAAALSSAVKRLEQSFQQQRHFVSDAAHELKTAVAVLKSSLQLLSMRPRTLEEYEAGLGRCLVDCYRMEDIVAKMLTLARFESRNVTTEPSASAIDLVRCAEAACDQLQPVAEQRAVRLKTSFTDAAAVRMSPEEGTLLCSNLLMNAVQHSARNRQVHLSVEPVGSATIEMRIEDRGEGIDPEALPHVFERFFRGDPSRARKSGGTGLGLAICQAIVRNASGTIHLESLPGLGTTAVVRLPRADPGLLTGTSSRAALQSSREDLFSVL